MAETADARTTTLDTVDGARLAFCVWGPADGTPLFVLHGTPGSRFLRHVGGEYERVGARTATYDRPGYGLSTRRPGRTVAQSAADVRKIADSLGWDTFAVFGVSGGGPSALAAAAAMPTRVTRCATVVGIGPSDAPDLDFYAGMSDEELSEWACARKGESCLAGEFYRESLEWAESMGSLDVVAPVVSAMLTEAFREGLRTPYGVVDDYATHLKAWGFDVADAVCPTRIMFAADDTSVPAAHGRWLASHIEAAVGWEVPGGHFGPREAVEEQLLGWLVSA